MGQLAAHDEPSDFRPLLAAASHLPVDVGGRREGGRPRDSDPGGPLAAGRLLQTGL